MAFYERDVDVMIDSAKLQARITELGQQITREYQGKDLTLIGIMKGSVFFLTDLAKAIETTLRHSTRAGMLVVVSDFFDAGPVLAALKRARAGGHDVALVQVVAPEEVDPTPGGSVGPIRIPTALGGSAEPLAAPPSNASHKAETWPVDPLQSATTGVTAAPATPSPWVPDPRISVAALPSGVLTPVVWVARLLPGTGSAVVASTVASLVIVPAVVGASTVIVATNCCPEATGAAARHSTAAPPVHVRPAPAALTKLSPAGSGSRITNWPWSTFSQAGLPK